VDELKAAPGAMERPIVLLDRDGVINRRLDSSVRSLEDLEVLPSALNGLALLNRANAVVAIVSNQANLGRRLLTTVELDRIHTAMLERIEANGGRVDAVYVCAHTPDDRCPCRKPEPGMLRLAASELNFPLHSAYMVGDQSSDIEAARRAGCRAVLVTDEVPSVLLTGNAAAPLLARDLCQAAELIIGEVAARALDGTAAP
jgi:D-glycero-D-manno-heptose 1,7-bisphosphate phosphatase